MLQTSDVGYRGKQPDVGNYFILTSRCKNHAAVRTWSFKVQNAFCKSPGLTFPKNAILETENINFELELKLAERLPGLHAHATVCHHFTQGHEKPDIEKRVVRLRENQELPLPAEEGKTRPVRSFLAEALGVVSTENPGTFRKSFCCNFLPAFLIQTCYLLATFISILVTAQ